MKHRTHHSAEAHEGLVAVGCSCGWHDFVSVIGLSYIDAMEAIYAARDAHEAAAEEEA